MSRPTGRLVLLVLFGLQAWLAPAAEAADNRRAADPSAKSTAKSNPPAAINKQLFSGRVVRLKEALKRRGVKTGSEFDKQVVLESVTGELIPIVPDWRGRAFYQDKRLRNRRVDLVGYRRAGIPYLQVLMVFTVDKRKNKEVRQYFDYWCDICSIPMYEIKMCECCQGPIRMRFQSRDLPSYLRKPAAKTRRSVPASSTKAATGN